MTLPNFLIIGAPKSGTSSLYEYLRQHPQVFMSREKETNYFAFQGGRPAFRGPGDKANKYAHCPVTIDLYQALFAGASDQIAVGEASPIYLSHPAAAERIHQALPQAKLVAVLRNPTERAFSAYMMRVRDGLETLDFAQAIQAEPERIRQGWSWGDYVRKGFYYEQLRRYFDRFGREQVRVYLFDDFARDPRVVLQDLFGFLGVDPTFQPEVLRKHNQSGVIRSPLARILWTRSRGLRGVVRPLLPPRVRRAAFEFVTRDLVKASLPPDLREELRRRYRPDIFQLERLLQVDLSCWLETPRREAA